MIVWEDIEAQISQMNNNICMIVYCKDKTLFLHLYGSNLGLAQHLFSMFFAALDVGGEISLHHVALPCEFFFHVFLWPCSPERGTSTFSCLQGLGYHSRWGEADLPVGVTKAKSTWIRSKGKFWVHFHFSYILYLGYYKCMQGMNKRTFKNLLHLIFW